MMYRNKTILSLANQSPRCMSCLAPNRGQVVAAHSNQIKHGKGIGIKAHDHKIAYLCKHCHHEIDNGNRLSKQERIDMWQEAHEKTLDWLFMSGHIEILREGKNETRNNK